MNNYISEVFDFLHNNPEKGFCEYKTSSFIEKQLTEMGYNVIKVGKTALVAETDSKDMGITLGIRCDMDALEFSKDGESVYIHACGHDAHSAIVLSVAKKVAQDNIKRGKLKFIFQAAEEVGLGAKEIIESGVVNDVDELIGIHLRPMSDTKLGEATCAVMHNASSKMIIKINGKPSHASRPHLGINVIEMGMAIVNGFSSIYLDPNKSYSIKATQFETIGNSPNTIPYEAHMTIDIRTEDNESIAIIKSKLMELFKSIEIFFNSNIEIMVDNTMPGHDYDPQLVKDVEQSIVKVLGKSNPPLYTTGSEDFHYFKQDIGMKTAYIGLGADLKPGLHDMNMNFNTSCLEQGVEILYEIIKSKLLS